MSACPSCGGARWATPTPVCGRGFVDELLEAAGKDPIDGRLELLSKKPRHAGVLKAVAELADWKNYKVPEGRARGVAVVESFNTFVAQVVELSMTDEGEPKVHKVWCAVDCGVAVNPDIIRAQMEGGIGFGLGHILYAEQTLDAGAPVSRQFRHLSLAAHQRDAGDRGGHREIDREADRRRRTRRASARACRCQRAGETRSGKTASIADRARSLSMSLFKNSMLALVAGGLAAGLLASRSRASRRPTAGQQSGGQAAVGLGFAKIKNKNERAVALFTEMPARSSSRRAA
jgi:hypothetical protein